MAFLDSRDDVTHSVIGEEGVFAALEHERTETCGVALLETIKYLLFCQAVSDGRLIAPSYAAVDAVVFAEIGELH